MFELFKRIYIDIEPCPKCSCKPMYVRVGDNKQYAILRCPYCGYVPAKLDEARSTRRGAIKVWNKATKELLQANETDE